MRLILGVVLGVFFITANVMADVGDHYNVFTDESYYDLDSREGKDLADMASEVLLELGRLDRKRLIERINDENDKETSLLHCKLMRGYAFVGLELEKCVGIQFTNSSKVEIQGYSGLRFLGVLGLGVSNNFTTETYDGELPEESGGDLALFSELTLIAVGGTVETSLKFLQRGFGLALGYVGVKIGDSNRSTSLYEVEIKDDFYNSLMKE